VRFILGNLYDFNPDTDLLPVSKLGDLDRWALSQAADRLSRIRKAYEDYEFHAVYHQAVNFCVVDLSAVYFDILKDRLYTAGKSSPERRSSQTALWLIADALLRSLAPILSFTAEECWASMPKHSKKAESVFLSAFPLERELEGWKDAALDETFAGIWRLRDVVLKALEDARQAKTIGHPREAKVTLTVDEAGRKALSATSEEPSRVFLVSELELKDGREISAVVSRASGEKCARCWTYSKAVGKDKKHPLLCDRCVSAVQ
jgi:isoleucyl-tRNA synthetase